MQCRELRHICGPLLKRASSRAEDDYDMIGLALPAHQSAQYLNTHRALFPFWIVHLLFKLSYLAAILLGFYVPYSVHAISLQRAVETMVLLTSKQNLKF